MIWILHIGGIITFWGVTHMLGIITQPFEGQLGTVLKSKLAEDKYKHFVIVSAFAKNSGVLRMKQSLQDFHNRGGRIDAFIGLDAHGTSYEAVVNLFSLVDSLYIVHDNNPGISFHSKIYYLTDLQNSDWIAIGSNNLTGGGLWTNHETASIVSNDSTADAGTVGYFRNYKKLIDLYQDEACDFSMKIKEISDLDKLLEADLLRHEIQLQIDAAKSRRHSKKLTGNTSPDPFGSIGKIHMPIIYNFIHHSITAKGRRSWKALIRSFK